MEQNKENIDAIINELSNISDFLGGEKSFIIDEAITLLGSIQNNSVNNKKFNRYIVCIDASSIADIDDLLAEQIGYKIHDYWVLTENNSSLADNFMSPDHYVERNLADCITKTLRTNKSLINNDTT